MISIQDKMTSLVNRSKEAGHAVHGACLVIPNLAVKLTGEAAVNTKAFVIAFTNVSSDLFSQHISTVHKKSRKIMYSVYLLH